MYGVILAVGVLVAVYVAEHRWRRRGYPKDGIYDISFWVVIWGVIGARLYHVITDYQRFEDDPWRALQIWRGGLSIWGAVIAGAIAVVVITRRRHLPTLAVMDCMAPGIVLAQAIGRWGNYFNQELFGKPSTLPWALEIAPQHRPAGYVQYATFQPTFLYESLACLAILGILLLVEHRARLALGQTFALYVVLYTFARFWFENMRIDPAHEIAGMRVNAWVAIALFAFGVGWFVWLGRHEAQQRRPGHVDRPDEVAPAPVEDVS
jgi:prolipoprotein diacylglyceryl transferase